MFGMSSILWYNHVSVEKNILGGNPTPMTTLLFHKIYGQTKRPPLAPPCSKPKINVQGTAHSVTLIRSNGFMMFAKVNTFLLCKQVMYTCSHVPMLLDMVLISKLKKKPAATSNKVVSREFV